VDPGPGLLGDPCQIPWHQDDGPCKGKRPLVKIKDRDKIPSDDQIRRWWQRWPKAQLAILTDARSNLVVIDVDGPEGEADPGPGAVPMLGQAPVQVDGGLLE
jgi:hypothetical protein